MTTISAAADEPAGTARVFGYFAPLTLLVYLVMPHGYLLDFATWAASRPGHITTLRCAPARPVCKVR